jgi:hypothetical protein
MTLTEAELEEARKVLGLSDEAIASGEDAPKDGAPYYCPGCGRAAEYRKACTGSPEQPHKPIEVVSTDELKGDPENHTAAPNTD